MTPHTSSHCCFVQQLAAMHAHARLIVSPLYFRGLLKVWCAQLAWDLECFSQGQFAPGEA